MKLTIGYISAFLTMTAIVTAVSFAIFAFTPVIIMFITWAPLTVPVDWFLALRVCILIGVFFGSMFVCSKEGRGFAKDVKDMLDGR